MKMMSDEVQRYGVSGGPGGEEGVYLGWPNEGIEYWNAYWRWQAARGFFDDIWASGGL